MKRTRVESTLISKIGGNKNNEEKDSREQEVLEILFLCA